MLVRSRTMEKRSVLVRHPTLPCAFRASHAQRMGDKAKPPVSLVADGFAANPQMTTRRFPPPWSAACGCDIDQAVIALRLVLQLEQVPTCHNDAQVEAIGAADAFDYNCSSGCARL